MPYTPTNLKRWSPPSCYVGPEWLDYYSAGVGQSRDSKPLEESNFRVMLRLLGGESPTVVVVRESHWAVGWIEWIAIHESDHAALAAADKAIADLADYPVLDDEDFGNLEDEQICQWWSDEPLSWRMRLCRDNGASVFAARRDVPPETVYESLRENL